MSKAAALEFEKHLQQLFADRTSRLLDQIRKPKKRGGNRKLNRQKIVTIISELETLATRCLLRGYDTKGFKGLYDLKKQWHVRGRGPDNKQREFKKWFTNNIPHSNFIYIFWNKRKCVYIGRTLGGKNRPTNHFDKHWFSGITRIDIYSTSGSRKIPKLECIATHKFGPSRGKIKPANKKHASKCPICETHNTIRREVKYIFRLK